METRTYRGCEMVRTQNHRVLVYKDNYQIGEATTFDKARDLVDLWWES